MPQGPSLKNAIVTITQSLERLRSLSFAPETWEPISNLASIIALRLQMGAQRHILIGFIGCTGTGKSTIFNSLTHSQTSTTGWKAHNTRGPIMLSDTAFHDTLLSLENQNGGKLLFPTLEREMRKVEESDSTLGSTEALHWLISDQHSLPGIALIDLPDINTTRSREERLIALELLPWLDRVIFVMDEETLYHRDYEEPVRIAKTLNQNRLSVINNRGTDRIDLKHPDLQESMRFFGVETLHVLPVIKQGNRFQKETEFLQLEFAIEKKAYAPVEPLQDQIRPYADKILQENKKRRRVFQGITDELDNRLREEISHQPNISFEQILNDEALAVLQHLGLKRFAISNLMGFFKNVASTGSLRRSFALAFGNRREDIVLQVLNLDTQKMKETVSNRLRDLEESSGHIIRRSPHHTYIFELAPELKRLQFILDQDGERKLKEIEQEFENCCRSLIQSDTLSSSIQNDPLVAAGVIVTLFADVMTLPGFGSWLLVPSVMKYLPLGKFEKAKRDFQQAIRDLIQETVTVRLKPIQTTSSILTLDSSDPLFQALQRCSHDHRD